MKTSLLFAPFILHLSATPARAANIVLSNDDGWAEINIRTLFNVLEAAGENVVLSAPAENESGTGSLDATPTTLTEPCEFDSCPSGSPPYGYNSSNPRLNYVNSYPVTSMRYGIQNLSLPILGVSTPDIALSGFNVGSNTGLSTLFSGTVGAACEAAKEGIPAIAFSGSTGSQTAWTAAPETYETVYADLSLNVTETLLASGAPFLPSGIFLNVNFGAVSNSSCTSASDFSFVLSRIYLSTGGDVVTCDNGGFLPTESDVIGSSGCWASISVGVASTKFDASESDQATVLGKLNSILSCLPASDDELDEVLKDIGNLFDDLRG